MRLDPDSTLAPADRAVWRDYERSMREQRFSQNTIDGYAWAVCLLAASGAPAVTATRQQVSDLLIATAAGKSPGTLATLHRRLARWFTWLCEEELIGVSPMARIKAPRPEHKAPAILEAGQLSALLAACTAPKGATATDRLAALRDRAMVMLLCEPGSPRAHELAGLTLDDVDITETDSVFIRGKGGVERVIGMGPATARAWSKYLRARALHPAALAEAEAARREHRGERALLGKRGPVTRSGVAQILNRRAEAAGLPHIHPHQLRHTAFDRADNAGLPPRAAAKLFGWKSTKMCDVYGRAAAARRAVELGRDLGLVSGL